MEKNILIEGCPSCSSVTATGERERVLKHWPIQIKLIGTVTPFLKDADLTVAADCTAFSVSNFHDGFLGTRKLLIGCPKLDGAQFYVEKFAEIFAENGIKSLECVRMEVPCCGGMTAVLAEAMRKAGRKIPFKEITIGVRGDLVGEKEIEI